MFPLIRWPDEAVLFSSKKFVIAARARCSNGNEPNRVDGGAKVKLCGPNQGGGRKLDRFAVARRWALRRLSA
jgi:hypothetical protein